MAHNLTKLQLKKLERSHAWLNEVISEIKTSPFTGQILLQARLLQVSASNIETVLQKHVLAPNTNELSVLQKTD